MSREQRIRERAYQIWESEGRPHGRQEEHWRRAEAEIDQELAAVAARHDTMPLTEPETPSTARPVTSRPIPARKRNDGREPVPDKKKTRPAGPRPRPS
jgi:DUF2934 family protein